MSAIGQGAPGGAGGAPAPGAAPAAGGTAPAAGAAPTNDPWGFAAAVASAPEALRGPLQTEFDRLAPTLTERMERYSPLDPYLDRLSPLLEPAQEGEDGTFLDGMIALFDLFNDESRADDLADWWEAIGDEFELWGDDDEPGQGQGAAAAPGQPDLSGLDPAVRALVEGMQQTITGLEARLGEFETTSQTESQQRAVNDEAARIRNELTTLIGQHKIDPNWPAGQEGGELLQSPAALDILRLARGYGADPEALQKGVGDYMRMTGQAQTDQLHQLGEPTTGIDALRASLLNGGAPPSTGGGGGPSHALDRGGDSNRIESVKSFDDAKRIAMERMQAAG